MTCLECGTENEPGRKFCGECGASLARGCPSCGAQNSPGVKFCGDCGASLVEGPEPEPARQEPAAERRLVSVLFADLVGFTALGDAGDPEESRELLSRYFEMCSSLIERYGGTVEKFIGDAVMAVWGTPTAQEDDAERAVRTALDLVAAIPDLHPSLQARAGVLTGEAAVTLGAEGQGMVAGDLVNTASRVQTLAEPGAVLVGESTKRASEAAIAYEDAGTHELKGKTEPVQLFQALRVTAARGGALKSTGLEPPFVGRNRELRLVKELFHASAEEQKEHLVSVVGIAGIGKSRLAWEFFKYIDGLADLVFWHRGRCLAYGEGVAYWALAEMVRMRCGIAEGEPPEEARSKLESALEEHLSDEEERSWIEPCLAHLLALEERQTREREDLFAAWRVFFERLAEQNPVVLVFEDMQWADPSLLEFVDHLLEWARNRPLYVLALARPELTERHPGWGSGRRNSSTLSLEPLSQPAMEKLLDGFVPGLPSDLREQILARSEGVPLYAVETVRMLLDRGLLERAGERYRPTGPIEALEVPETLHALVAARLDGLAPEERRLVQHASVLGKTFSKRALAALEGGTEADAEALLVSLVRKEVLTLQADPRSPERGQYGFLQDLLKRVAYETLARRERKGRHLAAAAYLERDWGPSEQEIVEVVAAHYLAAYEAVPDAEDADRLRAKAGEMLARAGERASSLAANEEAMRYYAQAAELADDPHLCAELYERAGQSGVPANKLAHAERHFQQALELLEGQGETHGAARVSAQLGAVEAQRGGLDRALARLESAFAVLAEEEPDADFAALAAELGRLSFFAGNIHQAAERVDTAIAVAEALWLPEVLAQALTTASLIAHLRGRPEQGLAFVTHARDLALEHGLWAAALRAYGNLGDQLDRRDRYEEALEQHGRALALARRVGNRFHELRILAEMSYCLYQTGRWQEAFESSAEPLPQVEETGILVGALLSRVFIELARGDLDHAKASLLRLARLKDSPDIQDQGTYAFVNAALLRIDGRYDEALRANVEAFRMEAEVSGALAKLAYVEAVESAFALGRLEKVEELLSEVEALRPGELPPTLRAQALRFRARLCALRGEHDVVEGRFKAAEAVFREFGLPFWLAVTELEHGEWLIEAGRADEAAPLLAEARETFERLEATLWLERVSAVAPGTARIAAEAI